MKKKLFAYIQYIFPHYLLTYLMGLLADSRLPWLKNFMIRKFIKTYQIDMSIAEVEDTAKYPNFNSFFVRTLKPALRPIAQGDNDIASPVDGIITQIGEIRKNHLLQVKGTSFDLETLLGGDSILANTFYNGSFATLYLAPHNYHRVHSPLSGQLEKTIFVPGRLFSVNAATSEFIPQLYSRNERLISIFSTKAGPMAVILVGAMIVGSIQTAWRAKPYRSQKMTMVNYDDDNKVYLPTGAELGQFKLGSTVILLFGKNKITWLPELNSNSLVHFGQLVGNILI